MKASVLTRWFVGLGLLGLALAPSGTARAQRDEGPGRSIREELFRLRQLVPGQEILIEPEFGASLTPQTHGIGVAVEPVDETMRAHLDLPEKQGVVVTDVAPDSPADKAGLKPHDIVLKLGEDPVNVPEDLDERFRDGGEEPVTVQLLRGGKPTTVQVTPRRPAEARDYYIGVSAAPLSDALRSHLDLPEDQGVVAMSILPDSPAAKAGIQPNDIVLTVAEQPVRDVEGLVAQIQEIKDKTVPVQLLRGGKPVTVEITPEKRKEPLPTLPREGRGQRSPFEIGPIGPGAIIGPDGSIRPARPGEVLPIPPRGLPRVLGMPSRQLERRLDEVADQLKELRKAVEELQKATQKE